MRGSMNLPGNSTLINSCLPCLMILTFMESMEMRHYEGVKLKVGDIDSENGLIHLPAEIFKTNMAQVKPIIGILKLFFGRNALGKLPKRLLSVFEQRPPTPKTFNPRFFYSQVSKGESDYRINQRGKHVCHPPYLCL